MKTNAVIALFLAVALVLVGGCQTVPREPQTTDKWTAQIAGSYKGTILSGKTEFPGTTTFRSDEKGLLSGTYELTEKDGTNVPGKLFDFRVVAPLQLQCRWEDKNGTGDFSLTFTDDLSRFDGLWNVDGNEKKHGWNGAR